MVPVWQGQRPIKFLLILIRRLFVKEYLTHTLILRTSFISSLYFIHPRNSDVKSRFRARYSTIGTLQTILVIWQTRSHKSTLFSVTLWYKVFTNFYNLVYYILVTNLITTTNTCEILIHMYESLTTRKRKKNIIEIICIKIYL